jgi:RNA polymerase sigma-70 factor (ECF subfamily)
MHTSGVRMKLMIPGNKPVKTMVTPQDSPKDKKAFFDVIYRRSRDQVFTFCLRFLGSYPEAEDCTQDVFVKAYEKFHRFREASSVETWLYRISVNTCLNWKRSVAARRRLQARFIGSFMTDRVENRFRSPDVIVERKVSAELVRSAIAQIPPARRSVVILRDINGLSYEDITEITGLRMGTLKSRIARGRRDLAVLLRGAVEC